MSVFMVVAKNILRGTMRTVVSMNDSGLGITRTGRAVHMGNILRPPLKSSTRVHV